MYLEVCHASKAVLQIGDLLTWTSAAHLASKRQRSSAMTAWVMRATALISVNLFSRLLASASAAHASTVESCHVLKSMLHEWIEADTSSSVSTAALYKFPSPVAGTSMSLYEIFERLFSCVEKFLSAGNRSALYGVMASVLIRYYNQHASMCTARYNALCREMKSLPLHVSEVSNVLTEGGGSEITVIEDPTGRNTLTDNHDMASGGNTSPRRKDLPLPGLINTCERSDSGRPLGNGRCVDQVTEDVGGTDVSCNPASNQVRVVTQMTTSGEVIFEMPTLTTHSTSVDNVTATSTSTCDNVVNVEAVVAWCRGQSSWQSSKPSSALKSAIAASLLPPSQSQPPSASSLAAVETKEPVNDSAPHNSTNSRKGSKRQRSALVRSGE